jgi:hypothetical protein
MNTIELVRESNRIEGILREPTTAELIEFERFLTIEDVTISDLVAFVNVYQPGAVLRDHDGFDVRVGNHIPPRGGVEIPHMLGSLLYDIRKGASAWDAHCRYETIHPFTDGNGRSGRMLWYWQMANSGGWPRASGLGFLHAFYYQTLGNIGRGC